MGTLTSLFITGKHIYALLLGIFGIGFLIAIHETGHFLLCKLFKVKTPSFSIGFGPHIFKKKIGDTLFTLSAIPMGGYVEIAGIEEVGQGEQKEAKRRDQYSFASKPYYQKVLIMAGGIIVNILFTYFVFILLFATGVPKTPLFAQTITTKIAKVQKDSAANKAQLQANDTITKLNNTPITSGTQLFELLRKNNTKAISLTFERAGETQTVELTPQNNTFGIQPALKDIAPKSLGESIKQGIKTTNNLLLKTLGFFGAIFNKKTFSQVGGPLMIITQAVKSAHQGIKIYLLLLAIISANLAVLNILPLPILDGGQILIYTIEALIGKSLPEAVRLYTAYATWIMFIALTIYLTYKDLLRIISSIFS